MFNFFNRPKVSIQSLSLPVPETDGEAWTMEKDDAKVKLWIHPAHTTALSLHFFDMAPDIPSLQDLDDLRGFYRKLAVAAKGGLIAVDLVDWRGFAAVVTIVKIPQDPNGTTYVASLTLPFKDCSFVVKVQAIEVLETGMREALVLDQLMETGVVKLDEDGLHHWIAAPYEASVTDGSPMNQSEKETYDDRFPSHPLTIARRRIQWVITEMQCAQDLAKLKPFGK